MSKRVYTISEHDSFESIVNLLVAKKISGAPVISKKGRIIGVISEKDLLYKLFPTEEEFYTDLDYYKNFQRIEHEAERITNLKAEDIMTKGAITIEPDRHVLVACSIMVIHGIRRLPVVKHGKLLGIVTTDDLYGNYLSHFLSNNT